MGGGFQVVNAGETQDRVMAGPRRRRRRLSGISAALAGSGLVVKEALGLGLGLGRLELESGEAC